MRGSVLLALLVLLAVSAGSAAMQGTATLSGTITHAGGPVAGMPVLVVWDGGGVETVSGADGTYQAAGLPVGGWAHIHIFAPPAFGLAGINHRIEPITGDMVVNFELVAGHQLRGQLRLPDGSPLRQPVWVGANPTVFTLPEGEWLGTTYDPESGFFEVMLPPDVYTLTLPSELRPLALPPTQIDLRDGAVTDLIVTLVEAGEVERFPTEPPRAELIHVSAPDADGTSAVTGEPGAVAPLSSVFLGNLSAHTFATTLADAEGGFSASLYLPPGSALLVKYGFGEGIRLLQRSADLGNVPDGDDLNELPGTIITVGGRLPGDERSQAFDAVRLNLDENSGSGWTGWWLSGTVSTPGGRSAHGLALQRGESGQVSARIRITTPDYPCTDPVPYTPRAHLNLHLAFHADGRAAYWGMWFTAQLFTPTGLPIEAESFGLWQPIGESTFTDVHCVGPHTFEGTAHFELWVPDGLPDGIYVPFFHVDTGGAPLSQSVPMNAVWYHYDPIPSLPPVVVGEVAAPRIPWTLLTDYPVNGYRGVDALENAGQYAQLMRTVIPPHEVVIPREDARTGRPIAYRLEPGSQWISSTDRRQPNPPFIPLSFPYGELMVAIHKPDGSVDILGPAPLRQSRMQMPSTPGGSPLDHGTGQAADIYHIATLDEIFAYTFDQYGQHVIMLEGMVADVHGNVYPIQNTYEVTVARVLDLDPGQLPTTPYVQGDAFSPGLHIFPPVPADVTIRLLHLPNSDPAQAVEHVIEGRANRYGVFQPAAGTRIIMETPGEFRVDLTARYEAPDGTQWTGSMTWGGVVEGTNARIEAHGRRAMAPLGSSAYMPTWYEVFNLPPELVGIEVDYPYFSGDVHWGNEDRGPGDSIQTAITFRDLTPDQFFYNLLRVTLNSSPENPLETQLSVHEAPLVTTTYSGVNPLIRPDDIHTFSYYYGSSERADVHVREIIASGGVGTPYWRFDDTYGYQIGESAEGDLPGDIKWEFGGAVLRVPDQGINEYAVYSSLWVLLPHGDPVGARITPPFQDATGASINGGPILTLLGEDIDMLFLPKGVRPGDVLEIGDTISFSGHVGPPLDSQVSVTITAPSGATWSRTWHANRIGWLYDPTFDFAAEEVGRWTVDVQVLHDRPYVGNGVVPQSHNTGTVLGTSGQYEFYVVPRDAPRLVITAPAPGFVTWPEGHVEPITIQGIASPGTTAVYYTVHDKGMVMDQGVLTPGADGSFTLVYDARALHEDFPFLSLTAHEGRWEGLSDEVAISFLAVGGDLQANTVTLIGEEVFIGGEE